MKVKKYIAILIATMLLAGFIACGGDSHGNDPLETEQSEPEPEPEPEPVGNLIKGHWIFMKATFAKIIFTEDFRWQETLRSFGGWGPANTLRTYEMIDNKSFKAENNTYYFTIEKVNGQDILTITYPNGGSNVSLFREE